MKQSKVYTDKKKGIHVCYKGSHYGAPAETQIDTKKRAELGPVEGTILLVKQSETTEEWSLLGAYTGAATKEEKAPASKKKPAKAKKEEAEEPAPKSKKKKSKKDSTRKRSAVEWKEPTPSQNDAVTERIHAAAGDEALPTLKEAWVNWTKDRSQSLFQDISWLDAEANERVQLLGRELMEEFGVKAPPSA